MYSSKINRLFCKKNQFISLNNVNSAIYSCALQLAKLLLPFSEFEKLFLNSLEKILEKSSRIERLIKI